MQYPLRILNTDEYIPFRVLLESDKYRGLYELPDGVIYIAQYDTHVYWIDDSMDIRDAPLEIEMQRNAGDMPIWRGWYELPNRNVLFVTHEREYYLHNKASVVPPEYRDSLERAIQNALRASKAPTVAEDE